MKLMRPLPIKLLGKETEVEPQAEPRQLLLVMGQSVYHTQHSLSSIRVWAGEVECCSGPYPIA